MVKYAPSRIISQMTGHVCDTDLPAPVRAGVYRAYSNALGVDLNELPPGAKLEDYKNFNEFFTRTIDLSKRPIYNRDCKKTMASPCDGKVLSFGTLKLPEATIECVKGADYPLEEFLFGFQPEGTTQPELGVKTMKLFCD